MEITSPLLLTIRPEALLVRRILALRCSHAEVRELHWTGSTRNAIATCLIIQYCSILEVNIYNRCESRSRYRGLEGFNSFCQFGVSGLNGGSVLLAVVSSLHLSLNTLCLVNGCLKSVLACCLVVNTERESILSNINSFLDRIQRVVNSQELLISCKDIAHSLVINFKHHQAFLSGLGAVCLVVSIRIEGGNDIGLSLLLISGNLGLDTVYTSLQLSLTP